MLAGAIERLLWVVVLGFGFLFFFFLLHGLSGRREGKARC